VTLDDLQRLFDRLRFDPPPPGFGAWSSSQREIDPSWPINRIELDGRVQLWATAPDGVRILVAAYEVAPSPVRVLRHPDSGARERAAEWTPAGIEFLKRHGYAEELT